MKNEVQRKEKDSGLRCLFEGGGEGSILDLSAKKDKRKGKEIDLSDDEI